MNNLVVNKKKKNWKGVVVASGILLGSLALLLTLPTAGILAQGRGYCSSLVVPPNEEAFALSYGEWTARCAMIPSISWPSSAIVVCRPSGLRAIAFITRRLMSSGSSGQ